MKRRDFIKRAAPLAAAPVLLRGMHVRGIARSRAWYAAAANGATDRVLVVIQLQGGNDGLNTVIPVDDDLYYALRPALGIPKADALALDGEPLLRMHPAMEGMQRLFNDGRLAVVENIGYEHNTMSHFAGTEIWNTASDGVSANQLATGWLGRFLETRYPDFPDTLPNDPPAIEISPATSSIFTITGASIAMSLTDPTEFYDLVNGGPDVGIDGGAGSTPAGTEKGFVDVIDRQSRAYADSIKRAAAAAKNLATYPEDNHLAASLAIIARLVAGGLGTRVYKVTLGNFDTHAAQAENHARLLGTLSSAVASFQQDLIALGIDDRVVGMTYSEFGRRAYENGTGTDHGAAAPHMVFGSAVEGGRVFGGLPLLGDLAGGNLRHTIDFQCYFASLLGPLFDLDDATLGGVFPLGLCASGGRIPVVRSSSSVAAPLREGAFALDVAPNPAAAQTAVVLTLTTPARVRIVLHDEAGRLALNVADRAFPAGRSVIDLDVRGIPAGSYTIVMDAGGRRTAKRLVVVR